LTFEILTQIEASKGSSWNGWSILSKKTTDECKKKTLSKTRISDKATGKTGSNSPNFGSLQTFRPEFFFSFKILIQETGL
jgi:hypothetical protein